MKNSLDLLVEPKNFIVLSKRLPKDAYCFLTKKTIIAYISSLDFDKIENKKIVLKKTTPNKIEVYDSLKECVGDEEIIEITNTLCEKFVKITIVLC